MNEPDPPDRIATSRLREAGLRLTRPRLLIYRLLRELGGHLAVGDILAQLAARDQLLPRMTVYNVLADLQHAGLLMTADAGPGRTLYEASEVWHHHYVCRRCRRVVDVPCLEGDKPCLQIPANAPGTVDEAQVIFRGICFECDRAADMSTESLEMNE